MQPTEFKSLTSFIRSVADLLRGSFKQSEYGQVIMPFVVMRRLDCLLEGTKDAVLDAYQSLPDDADENFKAWRLQKAADTDIKVYNTSRNTFARLRNQSPKQLRDNLIDYIGHFSPAVSQVFTDNYNMIEILRRLEETETLWPVFDRFCQVDLHPERIDNLTMGYLFEELLRKFSEMSNETAGEHFTPREIIRLCMALLMAGDAQASSGARVIRSLYDPTCGGGGGLSVGSQALHDINPNLIIQPYGQEMNPASYGICQSDMLIRGEDPENIALGNTLTDDKHEGKQFHFMFANPPYGVDWKRSKEVIEAEHKTQGYDGRFGAGLPRTSDGQLLFVQHMVSKFRNDTHGSRAAIVMNGSPLFTGGAGSGESEIRRWLLENDLIDAVVALPTDLFYNTGIQTYVYLLTNRKPDARKDKVQLIDASGDRFWEAMRKSLGSKRREVPASAIQEIVDIYRTMPNGDHELAEFSKVFDTTAFGYREIRIERPLRLKFKITEEDLRSMVDGKPIQKLSLEEREALTSTILTKLNGQTWTNHALFMKALDNALKGIDIKLGAAAKKAIVSAFCHRDEEAEICLDKNGQPEADPTLRDHELAPLDQEWPDYVTREVMPFVPDAWVDESYRDTNTAEVGRIGYEINVGRYFVSAPREKSCASIMHEISCIDQELEDLRAKDRITPKPIPNIGEPHKRIRLRHIAQIRKGKSTAGEASDKGECALLTLDFLRTGQSPKFVSRNKSDVLAGDGDVLIVWDGSNAGEILKARNGLVSSTLAKISVNSPHDPDYLYFALKEHEASLRATCQGMGIPHVDGQQLRELRISWPDISVQKQIASQIRKKLDLVQCIAKAEQKKVDLLDEYQRVLVREAMTSEILDNVGDAA